VEKFRTGGASVREYCPQLTKEDCCRSEQCLIAHLACLTAFASLSLPLACASQLTSELYRTAACCGVSFGVECHTVSQSAPCCRQSEQRAVRVWPAPLPAPAVPLDGRVPGQLLVPGHLPPHAQLQVRALRAGLGARGGRQGAPELAAGSRVPAGTTSYRRPNFAIMLNLGGVTVSLLTGRAEALLVTVLLKSASFSHMLSHRYTQALQEPQWVNCDVRSFDMSVLGKFGVIMTDPVSPSTAPRVYIGDVLNTASEEQCSLSSCSVCYYIRCWIESQQILS
jgi:hypothetical protein